MWIVNLKALIFFTKIASKFNQKIVQNVELSLCLNTFFCYSLISSFEHLFQHWFNYFQKKLF